MRSPSELLSLLPTVSGTVERLPQADVLGIARFVVHDSESQVSPS